jgi:BirA family biotin operon repressor/biotin-[acetyl-CoA-carboxylase] ligase
MAIGSSVIRKAVVTSTNDLAKELARDGAEEGLVVVAEEQSSGRGRRGQSWYSPRGGLYFSVLLRPRLPPSSLLRFTILVAEPVAAAVEATCGCHVEVKWPNDIIIEGKKVGGLLVETASSGPDVEFLVLGVGINLRGSRELASFPAAGSLAECCSRDIGADHLLGRVLEALDRFYRDFQDGRVDDTAYTRRSSVIGRPVEARVGDQKLKGRALYLDMDGALVMRTDDGMILRLESVHDTSLRVIAEGGTQAEAD